MSRNRKRDCGQDCRYRRLYEGSQSSLNDMASKQTAALQRISTLRAGLTQMMKQHFAREHSETEQQLGHKIGAARDQDAVLVALLDGYIRGMLMRGNAHTDPDMEALRQALASLGIGVAPGADARALALAVRASQSVLHTPSEGSDLAEPAQVEAPSQTDGKSSVTNRSPAPGEDLGWEGEDVPWGDEAEGGLLEAFTDEPGEIPSSVVNDPKWDLSDLFDEPEEVGGKGSGLSGEELLASLTSPVQMQPPAQRADQAVTAPKVATPSAQSGGNEGGKVAGRQQESSVEKSAAGDESSVALGGQKSGAGRVRTSSDALRPQMFPETVASAPKRKKREPRRPRVAATPPKVETTQTPHPEEGTSGVATERFGELYDLVAKSRPVFMSDLVQAVGSPGLVRAWAQTFEDLGTSAPVRVITPRAHHRKRGELVIPYSQELRERFAQDVRTCWSECLDGNTQGRRLRGALLYEVAVLLQRFHEDIISYKKTNSVLVLRVKTAQGVMGVVMWLESGAQLQKKRGAIRDAVGEMIGERLDVLAVLTHETSARAVERLAGIVGEEAAGAGWEPTMPVIACHSWEFATDSKASAVSVL